MLLLVLQVSAHTADESALLNEATGPVMNFVESLANASVPCGIEIRVEDARGGFYTEMQRWESVRVPNPSATFLVELANRFNSTHGAYRASVMHGVVVVRPSAGDDLADSYLDRPYLGGPITVDSATRAALQVWEPAFAPITGGIGGSGSATPEFRLPVHLGEGTGLTAIDLLNQLVLQLPRVGWFVMVDAINSTLHPGFVIPRAGRLFFGVHGPLSAR
jgi:hypothetical protein